MTIIQIYTLLYIFSTDLVTRAVLFALSNYLWFAFYVMVGMLDDNSNRSVKTAPAVRHPECVRIHFAIVIFVLEITTCKLPISLLHLSHMLESR